MGKCILFIPFQYLIVLEILKTQQKCHIYEIKILNFGINKSAF